MTVATRSVFSTQFAKELGLRNHRAGMNMTFEDKQFSRTFSSN